MSLDTLAVDFSSVDEGALGAEEEPVFRKNAAIRSRTRVTPVSGEQPFAVTLTITDPLGAQTNILLVQPTDPVPNVFPLSWDYEGIWIPMMAGTYTREWKSISLDGRDPKTLQIYD